METPPIGYWWALYHMYSAWLSGIVFECTSSRMKQPSPNHFHSSTAPTVKTATHCYQIIPTDVACIHENSYHSQIKDNNGEPYRSTWEIHLKAYMYSQIIYAKYLSWFSSQRQPCQAAQTLQSSLAVRLWRLTFHRGWLTYHNCY